jgi:AAA+ superfamily predicted ATPase
MSRLSPRKKVSLQPEAAQAVPRGYTDEEEVKRDFSLWSTSDNIVFLPSRKPVKKLPCGLYEILQNPQIGLYFNRVKFSTENIIKFPDTESEEVIKEIETFWEREETFKSYGLSFKRGILLHGPPGSGKTSLIKLLIEDVINRQGIVIKFDHPGLFVDGMRILRTIQPDTPVVALMEDLDSLLECYSESEIINILDGVDRIEKIVFLATTNYPEKLGNRIVNRPSRFDRRFQIDVPSAAARKLFLESVMKDEDIKKQDIEKWVQDTDGLSIAHLKELFTSVVILGTDYDQALQNLKDMKLDISSGQSGESVGFGLNG